MTRRCSSPCPAPTWPAVSTRVTPRYPPHLPRSCAAGVTIGAHVGYRDLAGFGRRFMDVDPNELADEVVYQIGALQALAATEGGRVRYVKPHGGLYNAIVSHTAQARAVVDAVKSVDPGLPILGLPGSEVLRLAEAAGLRGGFRSLRGPRLQPGRHPRLPLAPRSRPA